MAAMRARPTGKDVPPLVVLCLATALMIAPAHGAWAADPQPRPATAVHLTSDQVADSLFGALRGGNYDAAFHLFDARMQAAVPEEKLRTLWEEQIAQLGAFQSWQRQAGDPARGYEVRLASLRFERGELKAMVAVDPVEGQVAGFFIRPASRPAAGHPAYADTTRFRALEVTVGSDPLRLPGTLTLPVGSGPFPAAVLVHGSGPQDRDETIGANKVFRDIAEGLASRGVAVLRYDKRSLRYPEALKDDPTIDAEVILDAVSAVKLLQARPEIDPKRVFVIGHSLGAQLAPEIGVRAGSVAGVALLAPPGRKPWDIVVAQMRYLGTPDSNVADAERSAALLRSGKAAGRAMTFAGAPLSYWQDWGRRDGPAQARKLGRPILVLHGNRDFQIADEDIAVWKKRLDGVKDARFVSLPGLNHLFIEGTGKPGPAEYDTPGHVDARVIDELARFITR
ncbi:MAG TPA: alpha/beta fold hydrolase [Candidatus Omnitrophota bacterium]|nr:alpha/beta fold hydrolase [Candidatus Omnitrophota bacterium]